MSTSLNRAAELADLTPPPSIGRTQQFLADVSGPSQSFAQGVIQSRVPMPTVGLQTQSFSEQMANPVSRMLPADSAAFQDPYAARRADIQEFTKWLDRREALRAAGDSEPSEQTVRVSAQDLSSGVVVKPTIRPIRVQPDQPLQPVPPPASSTATAPSPELPAPAAPKEPPPEHWLDRALPVALRRVWTTNLALGSYMLGGLGGGAAGAAAPLALGMGVGRSLIGGGTGDFELLNHLRVVRSTLARLPVSPDQVPGPVAAAFHQSVPTQQLLRSMSAGASDRQAIIDQLMQYRPNMIGLVNDTNASIGGASKGFSNFPSSGGAPGFPSGNGFIGSGYAGASAPMDGGPASGVSLPSFSRGPIAGMPPSFRNSGLAASPTGGVPSQMTGPEYGQVTFASPPAQVASDDMISGGSAVSFSPANLVGSSSPLDSSALSSLSNSMPGAQMFYPALPGGALPPGATNVPLSSNLVQQMLSRSAGAPVTPTLAESIASKGAAAGSSVGGNGGGAGPASFQLVPSGRPSPGASGLFGDSGQKALALAGGGQAVRGGPLDFMGVPVRLAPSLGGNSSLASEQAVHAAVNRTAGGNTIRPEQFQLLRSKLFPSTSSATVEPNSSAWQQAAAAHGLRSASPEALMAPDSRLKPLGASDPIPQVEGGAANLKNLGISPSIAKMPPLTSARISAINGAVGGPAGKNAGLPPIGSPRTGSPAIGSLAVPGAPGNPPLSRFAPGSAPGFASGLASSAAPGVAHSVAPGQGGNLSSQPPSGASMPFASGSAPRGPFQPGPSARFGGQPPLSANAPGNLGSPLSPGASGSPGKRSGSPIGPPMSGQPGIGFGSLNRGTGQFPGPRTLGAGPMIGSQRGSLRSPGPSPSTFGSVGSPSSGLSPSHPSPGVLRSRTLSLGPPPNEPPPSGSGLGADQHFHPQLGPVPSAPPTSQGAGQNVELRLKSSSTPESKTPSPKSGPMSLYTRPQIGLSKSGPPPNELPSPPSPPSLNFQSPRTDGSPPSNAPSLDFAPGQTPRGLRAPGSVASGPTMSRTYNRINSGQAPSNRPDMSLRTPPPKSPSTSSTKTLIQKVPTSSAPEARQSSGGTKSSASSSSKKSGGNDVDLLATEVWTILQRRIAFEAIRAGRR